MRYIFHIDVDSAFLSWTAVERLELAKNTPASIQTPLDTLDIRTIPSAIGGDVEKRHGIILAKSTSAKKYGIVTGEPIVKALKKCPNLYLFPPDHALYARQSEKLMQLLSNYSPVLEKYSIDESFLDMTGIVHTKDEAVALAKEIKDTVEQELKFTVSIGISSNKLLAKMGSDLQKPNHVTTLFKEEIQKKMWPLPCNHLFFVGKATESKLKALRIRTIGDIAKTDRNLLISELKSHGEKIWYYANGMDDSPVTPNEGPNKGYGNSITLPKDAQTSAECKKVILSLTENVAARLRRNQVKAGSVSVTLRYNIHDNHSHQAVLENPTNTTEELYLAYCNIFDRFWNGSPVRLIGISAGKIISASAATRQLSFFEDHTKLEKWEKLDQTIDEIRSKFGNDAVQRATFLGGDLEHMTGKNKN